MPLNRITGRAAAVLLTGLFTMTATPVAFGQSLDRDRPGIDYYPSWMHEAQPWVSGRDQDYPVFRDGRFDREDLKFNEWRDEQIRRYGPNWRSRPGVQEEYEIWRESQ